MIAIQQNSVMWTLIDNFSTLPLYSVGLCGVLCLLDVGCDTVADNRQSLTAHRIGQCVATGRLRTRKYLCRTERRTDSRSFSYLLFQSLPAIFVVPRSLEPESHPRGRGIIVGSLLRHLRDYHIRSFI